MVPWERVTNVLELLQRAGYFKIEKNIPNGLWKVSQALKKELRNCTESCDLRLKKKNSTQKHRHSLTTWKPSYPFDLLSLNITVLLPPKSQGNKYILLILDQFSKWYEAVSLTNQEEKTVEGSFVEHWIVRFRFSVQLHSDQELHLCQKNFLVFAVTSISEDINDILPPASERDDWKKISNNYP